MGVCCGNRVGGGGGVTCVGEWGFLVKTTRVVEAVVIELVVALELKSSSRCGSNW